ncbi:MAG: hypothetical protein AAFX45_09505 [Pseudomonadota bacterium]
MTTPTGDLLVRLHVKGPRRVVAVASVALLAAAAVYLAVTPGMPAGARVFLVALGGVVGWGAWAIAKSTEVDLLLTRDGLWDAGGQMLAPMDSIVAVDRGVFAVKPPSGFVIRLNTTMPLGWAPGVWWRVGRRIGIGGAVSGPDAKAMAEILELALADRAGLLKRD